MKDEIIKRMAMVIYALNHVSVCGESNLDNLRNSIGTLKEISKQLEALGEDTSK